MTFFEHLDELRKRLINISIAYLVGLVISYPLLVDPILKLMSTQIEGRQLYFTNPLEAFMVRIKLALFAAFIVASPVIFFNIFAFLSPALKGREKKKLYFYTLALVILFITGVVVGFVMILPVGMKWLLSQGGEVLQPLLSGTETITVIAWFLFAFGIAFETPLVMIVLVKLGILSRDTLKANWRIVYMVLLSSSALLTPDWSPVTMLMLAAPMILLYHLTILVLRWL